MSIEVNPIKTPKDVSDNLKKLPSWVKCSKCGKPPLENDWLIEIIPWSNALIHQSCAANQRQFAGLNLGNKGDK
jgi:hypothetical protein